MQSRWSKRREGLARIKQRRSCHCCGWNEFPSGLDFHHVRGPKRGTLSELIKAPYEKIESELKKCIVLCAVCHRGVHSGDVHVKYSPSLGVRMTKEEREWIR